MRGVLSLKSDLNLVECVPSIPPHPFPLPQGERENARARPPPHPSPSPLEGEGEGESPTALPRLHWWAGAKVLLVLGLIGALLQHLAHQRTTPLNLHWNSLLLLGGVLSVLAFAAFAARFRVSLRIAGLALDWKASVRINAFAACLDFVVPISGGGDVVKYLKCRPLANKQAPLAPAAGIALDHLIGLFTAIMLACSLVWRLPVLIFHWPTHSARWLIMGGLLLMLGLFVGARRVGAGQITFWWQRISSQRYTLVSAIAWSGLMQALLAGAVYSGARGCAISIDYGSILWVLCASALSGIIPFKVGGLGARDVAGAGLYVVLGVALADAVVLASLAYGYRALIAVVGGLAEIARPVSTTTS